VRPRYVRPRYVRLRYMSEVALNVAALHERLRYVRPRSMRLRYGFNPIVRPHTAASHSLT